MSSLSAKGDGFAVGVPKDNANFREPRRAKCNQTIYEVNTELEVYIKTSNDHYAKFQLCEKMSPPLIISKFWPVLFEYRGGKLNMKEVDELMCHENAYDVLKLILLDAYRFHGVASIDFSTNASVLVNGTSYDISAYRRPSSHLVPNANPRFDRPVFKVDVSDGICSVSFHQSFLPLLSTSLGQVTDLVCG